MATIALDCQIVLDGQGYLVAPRSVRVSRPRVRKATLTTANQERWVDLGPGKRVWTLTILALNDLTTYGGDPLGLSGQQIFDAVQASYNKVAIALPFIDPAGQAWMVRFDSCIAAVRDARTQLTSPSYLIAVELVEA